MALIVWNTAQGCLADLVSMDTSSGTTGKLHINYNDDDIIIHCTDNPGRITFLRTSVRQGLKQGGESDTETVYFDCIQQLIRTCEVGGVEFA